MADWDDEELIASSQTGDKGAFGELVRRYRGRVQATACRFCGDPQLAEDIAQETFIKIWRNLFRFRTGSFKSWVYRITVNTAIDHARRTRPTVAIEDIPLAAPGDNPEAAALHTERAQVIRQAVLSLPPHSRAALILREYEDLSYKEIAAVLNIPLGTVMSRLNYARNRLRADLAPLLEEAHAPASH
ncbi:MAG: sigma-70 family RNA polymerase sigma factor [Chloroflexota bacterium]|nr:sigma-70 family RNA polymerase sigma factor [Chloroflexota bacterium]